MKNNKLLMCSAFIFIAFISLREIFFLDKNITIGHNWDWPFPNIQFLFNNIDLNSKYTWWDFNLGINLNLTISQLIPNFIISILSNFLNSKSVILLLTLLTISISLASFKNLLDIVTIKTNKNYLPAFLYAFSPFLFNEIIGGFWYSWISYAFAPILFTCILKYINTGSVKFLFGYLFSAIFVISALQNFVLIETIIFSVLIFQIVMQNKLIKKILLRYSLANTILILFNLYWILPFIISLSAFSDVIQSSTFDTGFAAVRGSTQGILNILMLTGYLDRNMYYYALPDFLLPLFIFSVFLIWGLILVQFIIAKKFLDPKAGFWLFLFLALIILIKGGNPPLTGLTMWFYNSFPLMKLYRSPQHLMFIAAFIIPILTALSLNHLYRFIKYKKIILFVFGFGVLIWISGWWYNGDIGHGILKDKQRDYIDFYTLSPGLKEIYERNEYNSLNHRILFLPAVTSPQYLKTEYQNRAQGGQPEYLYLKNPTFTSEFSPFANKIDISLCSNIEYNYINYFSLFSVKDVVLRYDIYPIHTESRNCWDSKSVKKKLDLSSNLTKFLEGNYEVGYTIKSNYFLPQIYTPSTITEVKNSNAALNNDTKINVTILLKVVSQQDYDIRNGIYFKEFNKSFYNNSYNKKDIGSGIELKIYENKNTPVIEISKINPTKYRIRVHQAKDDFPLIFSEAFNEGWQNYIVSDFTSSQISRLNNKNEAELIDNYEVLEGNEENQAKKQEIVYLIQNGYISTLGEGKSILFKGEKYKINFISQNFKGTIQNDNLPKGTFWETWLPGKLKVTNSSYYLLENRLNKKVVQLPDENHQVVNGYANSWFINLNEIKKTGMYTQNQDGSIDFELVIEYWPQRLFYIGLIISGLVLIILAGLLISNWRKRLSV